MSNMSLFLDSEFYSSDMYVHLYASAYSFDYFERESCSVVSSSLWPHGLYSSWNSPGQNAGVG